MTEIFTPTSEQWTFLVGVRSFKQFCESVERYIKGECTFCIPNPLNRVLWEDEHMKLIDTAEAFKRAGLKHQFLIIPKRHITRQAELKGPEEASYFKAVRFFAETYKPEGEMIFARGGNPRLTAASVAHLHWNVWVATGEVEISALMVYNPDEQNRREQAANEYLSRYNEGERPE